MSIANYSIDEIRVNKGIVSNSIELVNLLFIDIETTGLRPDRGAKVTEIAILCRNKCRFYWAFKDGENIEPLNELLPNVLELLTQGVVIGHNLPFDLWFISYEAQRSEFEGLNIQFIDTLSLSREVLPDRGSYKLSELLKEFEISVSGDLHTAITDAHATRALFWKLIEKGGISTVGEAGMKNMNWSSF